MIPAQQLAMQVLNLVGLVHFDKDSGFEGSFGKDIPITATQLIEEHDKLHLENANKLIAIQRDEIEQLKEANAELATQRIKQDELYHDLKNQAYADCARLQNRITELEKERIT